MDFCSDYTLSKRITDLLERYHSNVQVVKYSKGEYDDTLYSKFNIFPSQRHDFFSIQRKAEYLAGRIAARSVCTISNEALFSLGYTPFNVPNFPDPLIGSISHSETLAAAMISTLDRYRGIGIDVQPVFQNNQLYANSFVFNEEERELVAGPKPTVPACVMFSAKESVLKAMTCAANKAIVLQDVSVADCKQKDGLWSFGGALRYEIGNQHTTTALGYSMAIENHIVSLAFILKDQRHLS